MREEKKAVLKKLGKILLNNGLLIAILLYFITCGFFCNNFNGKWLLWLFISCFIGWLFSFFYKEYEKADEMTIEPVIYDHRYDEQVSWKDRLKNIGKSVREMSGWNYLRWALIISFLSVACYIMHESLSSLWIKNEKWDKIFCWFLSMIVIITLFWITGWITHQHSKINNSYKKLFFFSCIGLYILFDLAPFTFNYFHIYSNFGNTQIMAQTVKASDELIKLIKPIIWEEIKPKQIILDSLNNVNKEYFNEIKNCEKRKEILLDSFDKMATSINPSGRTSKFKTTKDGETTKTESSITTINNRVNQISRQIESLNKKVKGKEIFEKTTPIVNDLKRTDILLNEIDSLIRIYNEAKFDNNKENQINITRDIIFNVGKLNGEFIDDSISKKLISIINSEQIERDKALNDLFELILGKYEDNNNQLPIEKREIHTLLHKVSIQSVALSALIDLAPIFLALLITFPTTNRRKRQ